MPTPRKGYYTKDGTRVPSVTTILGVLSKDGLKYWAAKMERLGVLGIIRGKIDQGCTREDLRIELKKIEGQPFFMDQDLETACDIGTAVHDMAERFLRNGDVVADVGAEYGLDEEAVRKATNSFNAFKRWATDTKLKFEAMEQGMVSEKYHYGGTPDIIMVNEDRCIGDFKTSSGIYESMPLQLAAYKMLWEENHPDKPITGGYYLMRFDKEYGDFVYRHWPELDDAADAFLLARDLYTKMKAVQKRCK